MCLGAETAEKFLLGPQFQAELGFGGLQESFPIPAPADKAGPMVADFHNLFNFPGAQGLGEYTPDGPDAIGSFRTIAMGDGSGIVITEQCTNRCETGYSYSMTAGGENFGVVNCAQS